MCFWWKAAARLRLHISLLKGDLIAQGGNAFALRGGCTTHDTRATVHQIGSAIDHDRNRWTRSIGIGLGGTRAQHSRPG
jgi:hypothetical protein